MLNDLSYYFTYLDLICTDCGIFDEQTSNYLTEAANREYALFTRGERVDRVEVRLERVGKFLEYLSKEELDDRETYSLGMPENEMFTYRIAESFKLEKIRVLKSAKQQNTMKSSRTS